MINAIVYFLARRAAAFVAWAARRSDRLLRAQMTRAFPEGCEVLIVRHGCHSIPEGARARILRVNEDARDYRIQLHDPACLTGGAALTDGVTYVCPAALRRA